MRYLLAGLMMSLLACGVVYAQDEAATEDEGAVDTRYEVTGIPLYQGPEYDSLDSTAIDIENVLPEFHSFQHRPVDDRPRMSFCNSFPPYSSMISFSAACANSLLCALALCMNHSNTQVNTASTGTHTPIVILAAQVSGKDSCHAYLT